MQTPGAGGEWHYIWLLFFGYALSEGFSLPLLWYTVLLVLVTVKWIGTWEGSVLQRTRQGP